MPGWLDLLRLDWWNESAKGAVRPEEIPSLPRRTTRGQSSWTFSAFEIS
jgi:hypothetical protein